MVRNLDINLLRAFAVVAEHRSITAASRVLNLSQGAVSQQIARLEALCPAPLLTREARGVRLTYAGERLLGKARQLIALNDEIWTELSGDAPTGAVRLGLPPDLLDAHIPALLKRFAIACPQVEVTLLCSSSPTLAEAVARGELDLALVEEPPGASRAECLLIDRVVWVGPRGGRAHLKAPLPVSMVTETCAFRPAVMSALRGLDREWRWMFENGNLQATLAVVRGDLAVCALLETTVPEDLVVLTPEAGLPPLPAFAITLHLPDRPTSQATLEIAQAIRQRFIRSQQPA